MSIVSLQKSNDLIYEPGETAYVFNIRLNNRQDMPAPLDSPILSINCNNLITSSNSITNTEVIHQNQQVQLKESLTFKINYPKQVSLNTPYKQICDIKVAGKISSRLNLFYNINTFNPSFPQIVIQYPLQMSCVSAVRSISLDDEFPLCFELHNVSAHDLGIHSDTKRRIRVNIKIHSEDINCGDLKFFNKDKTKPTETVSPFTIMTEEIPFIRAGNKYKISGTIKYNTKLANNHKSTIKVVLELGSYNDFSKFEKIQISDFELQQTELFGGSSKDRDYKSWYKDFLLITNSSTEDWYIKKWESYFKSIDAKFENWNLSYYNGVALTKNIFDGKCIADFFENKVCIVINNKFKIKNDDDESLSEELLVNSDIFHSMKKHNIRFYFVGQPVNIGSKIINLTSINTRNHSDEYNSNIIKNNENNNLYANHKVNETQVSVVNESTFKNNVLNPKYDDILESPYFEDENKSPGVNDEVKIINPKFIMEKSLNNNFIKIKNKISCCSNVNNDKFYEILNNIKKSMGSTSNLKTKNKDYDFLFFPRNIVTKKNCCNTFFHYVDLTIREGIKNNETKVISRTKQPNNYFTLDFTDYFNTFKLCDLNQKNKFLETLIYKIFPGTKINSKEYTRNTVMLEDNFIDNDKDKDNIKPTDLINLLIQTISSDCIQEIKYYLLYPYEILNDRAKEDFEGKLNYNNFITNEKFCNIENSSLNYQFNENANPFSSILNFKHFLIKNHIFLSKSF